MYYRMEEWAATVACLMVRDRWESVKIEVANGYWDIGTVHICLGPQKKKEDELEPYEGKESRISLC